MTKEQSVTKNFNENISKWKNITATFIYVGLQFLEYKLAIEVDEKGHKDQKISREIKIQKVIGKELFCEFIRINPDVKDYDKYVGLGKMYIQISESTKKITEESIKKSLVEKLQLKLEFKPNHSIKAKSLRFIVKKYCHHYKICLLIV